MRTDKATIFDLFENRRRYIVPLFQRGYVWTRDDQWEPLWDDLVAQAAEVVRHESHPSSKLHKHFLGALVLNQTQTALARVPIVEIIDGQQRLTTLQILLAAIRDGVGTHLDSFVKESLQRLTANGGALTDPDEKFKVWPTSQIQNHVKQVMELGSEAAVEEFYGRFHRRKGRGWIPTPRAWLRRICFSPRW